MKLLGRPTRGWLRDARLWIVVAVLACTLFGFFGVPPILRSQVPRLGRTHLGREASRHGTLEPPRMAATAVEEVKKKEAGQELVACRLALPAD